MPGDEIPVRDSMPSRSRRRAVGAGIDAEAQAQASALVQEAMYHYWHGGDPQKFERHLFKGITLKGRFDRVESCFRQASSLMPERLDLRFGLASTLVVQNRVEEAIGVYREIAKLDERGFEAPILHAAFARALERNGEAEEIIQRLWVRHAERAQAYVSKFASLESSLSTPLRVRAEAPGRLGMPHAIVVLGYALARDGSLQPTKLRRLEKALELATLCDSPVVLTGGVQQNGVTEAFIMSRWLQEKGVPAHRLRLEDQAEDTVGNAIFTLPILRELGVQRATIVSSATHIRRALVAFEEAARVMDLAIIFDHLVELDLPSLAEAKKVSEKERIFVYRDLMRTSGLWSYPGMQR